MIPFEKNRARVSGGEIAYVEEGDPGSPAVLLLHGFPTSSFLWRDLAPMLAPWMRVIAPDLIGCGDSEKPEGVPLHISAQAGYVRELLRDLGIEDFAVVGHGHGGGVAQLLAIEGGVKAMVLVNCAAFDAWPSGAMRRLQAVPPKDERPGLVRAAMIFAFREGMGRRVRLTDDLFEEYLRPWAGEEGTRAFFRSLRAADGLGLTGIESDLERLECPAFILWGEDDPFLPVAVAERLSEAMPASTLALLPGCSHFVTEDAPEAVLPLVLDYLRSRYLGRGHGHGGPQGLVTIPLQRHPPGER
ncbi:MAG: alpha/beta fold hydrolase [Actinomycetota bacterium]